MAETAGVDARLAEHALAIAASDLPVAVTHAARRCIVDWYAGALPGAAAAPATLLRAALDEELGAATGARRARLLPDGQPATRRAAALINAAAAHTLEFDDIFRDAIYHPGAPTIAAALAVAEAAGSSGRDLLRAVVAGYEVGCRIGVAVVPAHYRFWHTTATVGCFGAAAAAGVLLGLDRARLAHALRNAATLAAGLQQAFRGDGMSKPLHVGRAAETGVLCALAAQRGVTGAPRMLDGERGFAAALGGQGEWQRALDGHEQTFHITRMTQKNHGCCGHAFAALDAIIALDRVHGIEPAQVRAIRVGTYATAVEVLARAAPASDAEARFSMPFLAATALLHGKVRLDAFTPGRLADPAIAALAKRVHLSVDAQAEAGFPRQRAARVAVELADGRCLSHHATTRKGDPDQPLTDAELEEKYRELAAPVLGAARADALLATLWRVDELASLDALSPA